MSFILFALLWADLKITLFHLISLKIEKHHRDDSPGQKKPQTFPNPYIKPRSGEGHVFPTNEVRLRAKTTTRMQTKAEEHDWRNR